MKFITTIPLWALFFFVFFLRATDVTLGTIRTVTIVKGYIRLSMVLGFFEVGIWVLVISQVINRIGESWFLVIAYAGGFAVGNAVGILVERRLALGTAVVRIVSRGGDGDAIAGSLRSLGFTATTFAGEGAEGPVNLVYVDGPRRTIQRVIRAAQAVDPDLFYVIEPAHESSSGVATRLHPVPHPTGWRAAFKKK